MAEDKDQKVDKVEFSLLKQEKERNGTNEKLDLEKNEITPQAEDRSEPL